MIRIPLEEAPPIPPKKLRGIDITRAQGQLITSVVRALISHFDHSAGLPIIRLTTGGITASTKAPIHTAGVYTFENLVIKFSERDFFILEFSTRSNILDTVDSPNSLVVSIFKRPVRLTQPLIISSLTFTLLGRLSPVSALVLSVDSPLTTMPSIGIFSPGFTTIIVPISTSSGSTCSNPPSCSIFA